MAIEKNGEISFNGAAPMSFVVLDDAPPPSFTEEQQRVSQALSASLKNYLRTTENLLENKYKHLREIVPKYLSSPGNVLAAICPDGVAIRYETRSTDERKILVIVVPEGINRAASLLSQNLVRVHAPNAEITLDSTAGMEMKMTVVSADGSAKDVAAFRILFDVVNNPPQEAQSLSRPYCLLSVRNHLVIELHGELESQTAPDEPRQPFVAKSNLRFGAGWECIEVFPEFDADKWKPEFASLWAETDILSSAVLAQSREELNRSLDPKAVTRRHYSQLLSEFKDLLDSDPEREQILQAFLQQHPSLLCPAFDRMWPKLPLGNRETDFVFRDATNEYLLVELEKSTFTLFRQDGYPTKELTHAQGQIVEWKRYLEDNLQTVQREQGLTGITPNPNGLIVIGRSHSLQPGMKRKLQTMTNESPKLRIWTYDDVYDNAKRMLENLLGPMWDAGGTTQIFFPVPTAP